MSYRNGIKRQGIRIPTENTICVYNRTYNDISDTVQRIGAKLFENKYIIVSDTNQFKHVIEVISFQLEQMVRLICYNHTILVEFHKKLQQSISTMN